MSVATDLDAVDDQARHRPVFVPRVGTDVQSIDEVAATLARFGDRYTQRLFTRHEILACAGSPENVAASLAARFAAKEAVLKVLRVDGTAPQLIEIEIVRARGGACSVRLYGEAARQAERAGLGYWDVSLSHSGSVATATAVALAENRPDHTMSDHTMSDHTMSDHTMSDHTMSDHTMSDHTMSNDASEEAR